jgi:hypothetical protein
MSLRFKRHYRLLVMLVLASTLLIAGVGDERIIAYSVPSGEQAVEQTISITGVTALEVPAPAGSLAPILDASYIVPDASQE